MPRPPRISLGGLVYHIINRGNNRQTVFKDEGDFIVYLKTIKKFQGKYLFKLYAYCLMNNHVHLIIEPSKTNTLSKIIQSITLSHIRLYHSKYKSSGHLWQGRFKSSIIQTDEYLLECIKYIELNPVRANMVINPHGYRWSSYRFQTFGEDEYKLVDNDPMYLSLADTPQERQRIYRDFISSEQNQNIITAIRKSICNDSILGTDSFIAKLRERLNISKSMSRGRHKIRNQI
jgi:putative transposase